MTLPRNVHFTIQFDNDVKTYIIGIPTTRQLIAIASLKSTLSLGQYRTLIATQTLSSTVALDLIDVAATFTTLCPQLLTDLDTKSLLDLPADRLHGVLNAYANVVQPWLIKLEQFINAATKITEDHINQVLDEHE